MIKGRKKGKPSLRLNFSKHLELSLCYRTALIPSRAATMFCSESRFHPFYLKKEVVWQEGGGAGGRGAGC